MRNKTLLKIRKKAGLSRTRLGDRLGVTYNAIANYELGYRWPDMVKAKVYIKLGRDHGIKVSLEDIYSNFDGKIRLRKGSL